MYFCVYSSDGIEAVLLTTWASVSQMCKSNVNLTDTVGENFPCVPQKVNFNRKPFCFRYEFNNNYIRQLINLSNNKFHFLLQCVTWAFRITGLQFGLMNANLVQLEHIKTQLGTRYAATALMSNHGPTHRMWEPTAQPSVVCTPLQHPSHWFHLVRPLYPVGIWSANHFISFRNTHF